MTKVKRFKTYTYSFITLMLLTASIFTIPNTVVFSAASDLSITTPDANAFVKPSNLTISGTYDNSKFTTPTFKADDSGTSISNSTNNATEWAIDGSKGTWTYTPASNALSEGTHTINISITDTATPPNTLATASVTFTIDNRPYISKTEIFFDSNQQYTIQSGDTLQSIAQNQLGDSSLWTDIAQLNKLTSPYISNTSSPGVVAPGDKIDLPTIRTGEDITNISKDAIIKIKLVDDQAMNNLVSNINSGYNPFKVMLASKEVAGTAKILENAESEHSNYVYDIFFVPNSSLTLNQTYFVYLDQDQQNPMLNDDLNGPVYFKNFKFTTKANGNWDDEGDPGNHDSPNPHGHYGLNTNMCAACHSTHVNNPYNKNSDPNSKIDPNTEGGSYLTSFNDKLNSDPSENYCTACHDGTLNNAPIVEGIGGTYHHDNPVDYDQTNGTNNLKEATSCTSCHNPHLEWSAENPNLLKDHYVYQHNDTDLNKSVTKDPDHNELTSLIIDSLDTLCEKCHIDDAEYDSVSKNDALIYDNKIFTNGSYSSLSYNKSLTATSQITTKQIADSNQPNTVNDYSLCLRCHNDKKIDGATDIETYYTQLQTNSGHFLASQDDGSKLNGPIPCAECHATHGSNNINMLKSQIGQENPQEYSATSGSWDVTKEKDFCMKCHNGTTSTAIYGIVGKAITDNHDLDPNNSATHLACEECHGGASKSFVEAAHAPQILTK